MKLEPAEQERLLVEIVRENLEMAGLRPDGVLAFDMATNFAIAMG